MIIKMEEEDIELEIQKELLKITDEDISPEALCLDENLNYTSHDSLQPVNDQIEDESLPSMLDYVSKIQNQTRLLEAELEECDELLQYADIVSSRKTVDEELIALAEQQCVGVEQLKQQVLKELEEEERKEENAVMIDVAETMVTGLLNEAQISACADNTENFFVTTTAEVKPVLTSVQEPHIEKKQLVNDEINKEETFKASTAPSENKAAEQNLYNGTVSEIFDSDKLEKQLLQEVLQMEETRKKLDQQRILELTVMTNQEKERELQTNEKRKLKHIEIQREEEILKMKKEQKDQELQKEAEKLKEEIEHSLQTFEKEVNELAKKAAEEKQMLEKTMQEEILKRSEKEKEAAIKIQSLYRGYCARKIHGQETKAAIEELREAREQQRIDEVQILIDEREAENKRKEEEIALQKAIEEQKKKEEEAERQRKIEEEKKRKEEEKQKKEEEKQRKKEEERQRKEEEKRRKEEEKRRKEEEKRRKEEEKRRKEEEDKRKKEEEKRQKEEEKERKLEEKKRKEQETVEEEKRNETKRIEEQKRKDEEEKKRLEEEKKLQQQQEEKNGKEEHNTIAKESEIISNTVQEPKIINDNKKSEGNATETETNIILRTPRMSDEQLLLSLPNGKINVVGEKMSPTKRGMTDLFIDTVVMANTQDSDIDIKADDIKTPRPPSSQKIPGSVYDRPLSGKSRKSNTPGKTAVTQSTEVVSSGPVQIEVSDNTRQSLKAQHELAKTKEWGEYLPPEIEQKRLSWIKECKPLSKIFGDHNSKNTKKAARKKRPRLPDSAKNLPELDEGLVLAAANVQSLKQVTTVELHDLPGCSIKTLSHCVHLKSLVMNNCSVVTTEGLELCHDLQYVNLSKNKVEVLSFQDLTNLIFIDVSYNCLNSIHGIDGCDQLRYLNLSNNRIARIGGLDSLKKLHTLYLSHNQLITSRGLSEAPTLQYVDLSHNHLPSIDDLEKLALLQNLIVSSNSLMQVPKLVNQVLLNELILNDNSISFISGLSQTWLPMLTKLSLNQNSITMLDPMLNLLLLEQLQLSNNQVLDMESIFSGLEATRCLQSLNLDGNPLCEEANYRQKLQNVLPYLHNLDGTPHSPRCQDLKRTEFERLCLSQREQVIQLKHGYENAIKKTAPSTVDAMEAHIKFFQTSHQLATDIRYTHEYGISMVKPKEIDMNFEITPRDISKSVTLNQLKSESGSNSQTANMKSKFEEALSGGTSSSKASNNLALDMKNRFEQSLKNTSSTHPASPTPFFEHNLTKTMSNANNVNLSVLPTKNNNYSSADTMKSKFEQALSKGSKNNGGISHAVDGYQGNTKDVRKSTSYITGVSAGRVKHLLISQDEQSLDNAATKIQAWWRGNFFRKQLEIAYNYAKMDDLDDDLENFAEIDLGEFDFNMDDFEKSLQVPDSPQIPRSQPVLGKPPSHPTKMSSPPQANRPHVPPLFTKATQPPDNPVQAWRNADSSLSNHSYFGDGKPPLPPVSRMSDNYTVDTHRSKKSEKIAEEWGFKNSKTTELMYARAKKLKYNAAKKKKLSTLDPKQRLALFRKLEETTRPRPVQPANRKYMPRKEYFQARESEIRKQEFEKHLETQAKGERTFEWVHTQVGNYNLDSSRIQSNHNGVYGSEGNLPKLDALVVAGGRTQFVQSPVSLDLQSVESTSTYGEPLSKPRKLSKGEKLPPIRTNSNSAPKERMSFRNPRTEVDVGWGGGRKRNK